MGFYEVLWASMGFSRALCEFYRVLWGSIRFYGVL